MKIPKKGIQRARRFRRKKFIEDNHPNQTKNLEEQTKYTQRMMNRFDTIGFGLIVTGILAFGAHRAYHYFNPSTPTSQPTQSQTTDPSYQSTPFTPPTHPKPHSIQPPLHPNPNQTQPNVDYNNLPKPYQITKH